MAIKPKQWFYKEGGVIYSAPIGSRGILNEHNHQNEVAKLQAVQRVYV